MWKENKKLNSELRQIFVRFEFGGTPGNCFVRSSTMVKEINTQSSPESVGIGASQTWFKNWWARNIPESTLDRSVLPRSLAWGFSFKIFLNLSTEGFCTSLKPDPEKLWMNIRLKSSLFSSCSRFLPFFKALRFLSSALKRCLLPWNIRSTASLQLYWVCCCDIRCLEGEVAVAQDATGQPVKGSGILLTSLTIDGCFLPSWAVTILLPQNGIFCVPAVYSCSFLFLGSVYSLLSGSDGMEDQPCIYISPLSPLYKELGSVTSSSYHSTEQI